MTATALSRAALVVATLVVLTLSTLFAMVLGDYTDRSRAVRDADLCAAVPQAPEFTTERDGAVLDLPYGDVTGCRVLDRTAHLFGRVDVSAVLLLTTARGPVLLDTSYTHLTDGRAARIEAVELPPAEAPDGLTAAERTSLDMAVRTRGGVRPTPWVIQQGDD